jgi:hypothetical protein
MTRHSIRRTLTRLYVFLAVVLAISLLAKFADHIPVFKLIGLEGALKDIYEFLRDMSLLIATGGVAYISNVYQKRSSFVTSLETEWRALVATKNALYAFCEKPYPTAEDYLDAFCRLSASIDNMRIVYRNVGETDDLIGLYPYAPLHDMRRALMTLDPRKTKDIAPEYRKLVRDAILQSFYALRETFLEELDLEQPGHPLLISGGRRLKRSGATSAATRMQERQSERQNSKERGAIGARGSEIDELLAELYRREQPGS